jgi:peptidoglycan biosynthesis protein MviN/MurJ (putative lipid II flippase)
LKKSSRTDLPSFFAMLSAWFMARMAAENKILELNQLLNDTLRYPALVVPFSILVIVLRQETVAILFQRGRFDAAATALTSQVLAFLMIGALTFTAQTILVRGYYAVQNTPFPALYGTTAVLLSIPENDRCFYVRYRILIIAKQSPFLDRLRKIVYPFLSI